MLLVRMLSPRLPAVLFATYSAICAGQTTARYTVTGTVLDYATNEPIRRALVAVAGALVFTGADGRFQAENIPEGQALAAAQKPGYFDCTNVDCGGNSSRGTTTITVHSGSNEVTLKLVPEAKIQGRIVDRAGEPVSGVQVFAMAEHFFNGLKVFRPDGAASTDENGNYHIEKLMPGTYTVKTTPHRVFSFYYPTSGDLPLQIYPQRFYPNAPDASGAQILDLRAGQEAEADFTLAAVAAVKISGSIMPVFPSVTISAEDNSGEETSFEMRFVSRAGKFVVFAPAGTWTLHFNGGDNQGRRYYGVETVTVSSTNVENLRILLQPLVSVPVRIADTSNETAEQVPVALVPRARRDRGGTFGAMRPSGEAPYQIMNVPPGKYGVQVMTENQCVDSVTSGNIDVTREDLAIMPGLQPQPIDVVLRRDCAALQISVRSQDQNARSTVVLLAASNATAPRTIQLEPGASASVSNLSPGEYQVYAFSNIDGLEYANPEAMREYSGQQITLAANQRASITLESITRREK